ncbi:MAG: asparaginase [Bacillota bacterium]|nr:asparaginase [Bacillota bacterium]
MKKILFISTGGTIVSSDNGDGFEPYYNVEKLIEAINMDDNCIIDGKLLMNIDSSNMNPIHWINIAKTIGENYYKYDSFIISHGTDTMAYTSSALTYLLKGLNKPVIITGAQHSIEETYTDAIQNLNDALKFSLEEIAGVYISFDGKLINGTRAIKMKTMSYDAFKSINYPVVASIKYGEIRFESGIKNLISRRENDIFNPCYELNSNIIIIKLFPGINPLIFDFAMNNYDGVIIESFGIGGIPFKELNIHDKVKKMTDHGVTVVITTQCFEEGVDLSIYQVGKKLMNNNIIFAGDMNTEAIVPKLMCALGKFSEFEERKQYFEMPINGDKKMIV